MIQKEDLKKCTGFDSFLECFLWLKQIGKSDQETIVCQRMVVPKIFGKDVPSLKATPAKLSIKEIKLLALEEIYKGLPTKDEMTKVLQSIDRGGLSWRTQEVIEILNNIKTK